MSTRQYGAMEKVNTFMRQNENVVVSIAEVAKATGFSRSQVNQVLVRMVDRSDYNTFRVNAGMYIRRTGATAKPNTIATITEALDAEKPKVPREEISNSGGRANASSPIETVPSFDNGPRIDPVIPFQTIPDSEPGVFTFTPNAATQKALEDYLDSTPTYTFVGYAGGTPIVRSEYNTLYAVIPLEDIIGSEE